jgi:hypothetical protein
MLFFKKIIIFYFKLIFLIFFVCFDVLFLKKCCVTFESKFMALRGIRAPLKTNVWFLF